MATCDLLMWLSHMGTRRCGLALWCKLHDCRSPGSDPRETQFSGCLHVTPCPPDPARLCSLPGSPPCDPTLCGSRGQAAQKGFPATCKQMLLLVVSLRSDRLTAGERSLTLRGCVDRKTPECIVSSEKSQEKAPLQDA